MVEVALARRRLGRVQRLKLRLAPQLRAAGAKTLSPATKTFQALPEAIVAQGSPVHCAESQQTQNRASRDRCAELQERTW